MAASVAAPEPDDVAARVHRYFTDALPLTPSTRGRAAGRARGPPRRHRDDRRLLSLSLVAGLRRVDSRSGQLVGLADELPAEADVPASTSLVRISHGLARHAGSSRTRARMDKKDGRSHAGNALVGA